MANIQIFTSPEFGDIRTVDQNGEPWFVGKDVAAALGYGEGKSLANAVSNHVDEQDKGVTELMTPGGNQKMVIINESGLYSLILSSKMPTAKAFKRWVIGEVLPALRKNGVYETVKAQQHIEQLEATNDRLTMAIQSVSQAKDQLAEIIDMRDQFIKIRDKSKSRFVQAKADYSRDCDSLRQAESLVQRAQNQLDSRIDQLRIVAFGLPAFNEIMSEALAGVFSGNAADADRNTAPAGPQEGR